MPRAKITKREAYAGVPSRLPVVSQEEVGEGGVRIKVRLSRPRWLRWFGVSGTMERSFELDSLGREVYESCDGRRDVKSLVKAFGRAHRLSLAEAEISVTRFLKTLMAKGLVAVGVAARAPDGKSKEQTKVTKATKGKKEKKEP